jgi:hypothetical protein
MEQYGPECVLSRKDMKKSGLSQREIDQLLRCERVSRPDGTTFVWQGWLDRVYSFVPESDDPEGQALYDRFFETDCENVGADFMKAYGLKRVTSAVGEIQVLLPQSHDPYLVRVLSELQGGLHAAIRVQSCGTRAEEGPGRPRVGDA